MFLVAGFKDSKAFKTDVFRGVTVEGL